MRRFPSLETEKVRQRKHYLQGEVSLLRGLFPVWIQPNKEICSYQNLVTDSKAVKQKMAPKIWFIVIQSVKLIF